MSILYILGAKIVMIYVLSWGKQNTILQLCQRYISKSCNSHLKTFRSSHSLLLITDKYRNHLLLRVTPGLWRETQIPQPANTEFMMAKTNTTTIHRHTFLEWIWLSLYSFVCFKFFIFLFPHAPYYIYVRVSSHGPQICLCFLIFVPFPNCFVSVQLGNTGDHPQYLYFFVFVLVTCPGSCLTTSHRPQQW